MDEYRIWHVGLKRKEMHLGFGNGVRQGMDTGLVIMARGGGGGWCEENESDEVVIGS